MTETVEITITEDWVQVAADQCEVQSISDRRSYNKLLFDIVIGGTKPSATTTAFMTSVLSTHANFHRSAPVWLRLNR